MKWFNRNSKGFQREQLVRLVTTNDERSMLLTTSPFEIPPVFVGSAPVRYRPINQRRLAPIDTEELEEQGIRPAHLGPRGRASTANHLRWPRPIIIPADLVPRDFDDTDEEEPSSFSRKFVQQSAESFFPVVVDEGDTARFNEELWTSFSYRLRCYGWSLWQKHLKDW